MLHVVVMALALALPPQEPRPQAAPPPADSSRPPVVGATVLQRPAMRFGEAAPATWPSAASPPLAAPANAPGSPSSSSLPAGVPPQATSPVGAAVPADTPVKRPRAIVYSDWYARRLAIHRVASYTLLPLLAAQYYTGAQLMAKGSDAPLWVIRTHAPLATTAAVVFSVNTVTGVWNLWDARRDPNGRFARMAHSLLMLASDGGFLVAGAMGHPAVQNGSLRSLHRTIALSSMGAALVGYAIMLPPFRR